MAAAKDKTANILLGVGGAIAGVWVLSKFIAPKKVSAAGRPSSPARGGAYGPYGSQDQSLLNKILQAIQNLGKSSKGGGASPSLSNAAKQTPQARASAPSMSITQALLGGFASDGVQENVLAGIFNAQHGYYQDQTVAQQGQGWLDSNQWNLGDLFASREPQLDYQQTQLFDLSGVERSVFGNYPSDQPDVSYGGYVDNPSIDYSGAGGGQDWSNYDWSGGNGGWDTGGGGDGGGGGGGGTDYNGDIFDPEYQNAV